MYRPTATSSGKRRRDDDDKSGRYLRSPLELVCKTPRPSHLTIPNTLKRLTRLPDLSKGFDSANTDRSFRSVSEQPFELQLWDPFTPDPIQTKGDDEPDLLVGTDAAVTLSTSHVVDAILRAPLNWDGCHNSIPTTVKLPRTGWSSTSGHHPRRYLGQDSEGNFDIATYTPDFRAADAYSSCPHVVLAIHKKQVVAGRYRLESLPIPLSLRNGRGTVEQALSMDTIDEVSVLITLWMGKERKDRQQSSFEAHHTGHNLDLTPAPISDAHLIMNWKDKSGEPRTKRCYLKIVESNVPIEELRETHIEDLATDERFNTGTPSFDLSEHQWPVYALRSRATGQTDSDALVATAKSAGS